MKLRLPEMLLAFPHGFKTRMETQLTRTGSFKKFMRIRNRKNGNCLIWYCSGPSDTTNSFQDSPRLGTLPTEILLEIFSYIISIEGPIRRSPWKPIGWGIPSEALSLACTCRRFAPLIREFLYSKTWFEFSGGCVRDPDSHFVSHQTIIAQISQAHNLYLATSLGPLATRDLLWNETEEPRDCLPQILGSKVVDKSPH